MVATSPEQTLEYLRRWSDDEREQISRRARERVLARHTAACRAQELVEGRVHNRITVSDEQKHWNKVALDRMLSIS